MYAFTVLPGTRSFHRKDNICALAHRWKPIQKMKYWESCLPFSLSLSLSLSLLHLRRYPMYMEAKSLFWCPFVNRTRARFNDGWRKNVCGPTTAGKDLLPQSIRNKRQHEQRFFRHSGYHGKLFARKIKNANGKKRKNNIYSIGQLAYLLECELRN